VCVEGGAVCVHAYVCIDRVAHLSYLHTGNAVPEDGDAQLDAVAQLKKEKEKNAALTARVKELEAAALKDAQTKAKYASLAQQMLGDACVCSVVFCVV
jgi:hypothetical protein